MAERNAAVLPGVFCQLRNLALARFRMRSAILLVSRLPAVAPTK